MHRTIRIGLFAAGLAGMLATSSVVAQGPQDDRGDKAFRHASQQIERVRDELQRAPYGRGANHESRNDRWSNNYVSHRTRAIDHLNMAMRELDFIDGADKNDGKKDMKAKK